MMGNRRKSQDKKSAAVVFGISPLMIYVLMKLFTDAQLASEADLTPRYGFFLCYVLAGAVLAIDVYLTGQMSRGIGAALSFGWALIIIAILLGTTRGVFPFDGIFLPLAMNSSFFLTTTGIYLTTGILILTARRNR